MKMLVQATTGSSGLGGLALQSTTGASDEAVCCLADARAVLAAWDRCFEGRPRVTRDLERLREMIERLALARIRLGIEAQHTGASALRSHVPALDERLRQLSLESEQIRNVIGTGTDEERLATLASRINEQLALYRVHLAENPRASRRLGLLQRMVRVLRGIDRGLEQLDAEDERVRSNRALVSAEIRTWTTEVEVLRTLQRDMSLSMRVRALRLELSQLARRAARDIEHTSGMAVERLDELSDRLDECAVQLYGLARSHDDDDARAAFLEASGWIGRLADRRRSPVAEVGSGTPELGPLF